MRVKICVSAFPTASLILCTDNYNINGRVEVPEVSWRQSRSPTFKRHPLAKSFQDIGLLPLGCTSSSLIEPARKATVKPSGPSSNTVPGSPEPGASRQRNSLTASLVVSRVAPGRGVNARNRLYASTASIPKSRAASSVRSFGASVARSWSWGVRG